jgi:hypothetical protein
VSYWLSRLAVGSDPKAMHEWRRQHGESKTTRDVLSQPVRHELNKFFFDVNPYPSKAERKQLWYDLILIDSDVRMEKIVRWFQNKRQYMKKQHERTSDSCEEEPKPKSSSRRTKAVNIARAESSNSDAESDSSSESESN